MNRQVNDQVPLGELLLNARLALRLSRADVAKATGINEQSLIRYERAGLDDEGQFPPSPKLAMLCFYLRLHPLRVLLSCLAYGDYWHVKGMFSEEKFQLESGHPDYDYMTGEVFRLRAQNDLFRVVLRHLFEIPDRELNDDVLKALVDRVRRMLADEADIREEFAGFGIVTPQSCSFGIPGIPADRREEAAGARLSTEQLRMWFQRPFPSALEENGPDQKDPGRSLEKTKTQKAVGAASKRTRKGARVK